MNRTLLSFFITLVVILFAGWSLFSRDAQQPLFDAAGNPLSGTGVGADLVSQLQRLDSLSLNTDLYLQPAFRSLVPTESRIGEAQVGRPNPFATLGDDNA